MKIDLTYADCVAISHALKFLGFAREAITNQEGAYGNAKDTLDCLAMVYEDEKPDLDLADDIDKRLERLVKGERGYSEAQRFAFENLWNIKRDGK